MKLSKKGFELKPTLQASLVEFYPIGSRYREEGEALQRNPERWSGYIGVCEWPTVLMAE